MKTWILSVFLTTPAVLTTPALAQHSGSPGGPYELVTCRSTLRDAATGDCIGVSSVPTLGMLFPLGPEFFVDVAGLHLGGSLNAEGSVFSGGDVHAGGDLITDGEVTASGDVVATHGSFRGDLIVGTGAGLPGKIGVGTAAPETQLHISRPFDPVEVRLEGSSQARIFFTSYDAYDAAIGIQEGFDDLTLRHFYTSGGTNFDHSTFSLDSWDFRRRATTATDVEARVTYNGNLQLDGTVSTGGADLAEVYPLAGPVEPGDVVAFSGDGSRLERAHIGSANRLAGVISSRPGIVLGLSYTRADEPGVPPPSMLAVTEEGRMDAQAEARHSESFSALADERTESPVDPDVLHEIEVNRRAPLALAGRVPVKVTGELGPIRAGDLLTLSSIPGRAARATGPGVVVGTALEDLEAGEGTILAFVRPGWYAPSRPDAIAALEREVEALLDRVQRLEERIEGR